MNMQTLNIDPEFKNLIPPLSDDERAGLEASIKAEGCRDAIIVWDNTIVDGHNRYEICTRLGVEFRTHEKFFPNADAVVEWVIKNQFGRRNLQPYDRARLALRLEDVYRARAKANQSAPTGGRSGLTLPTLAKSIDTREEVAKAAGMSHGTFDKVRRIEREATPEQKAELSSGKATINRVYKEIKERETPNANKQNDGRCNEPHSTALQFSTLAISQLTRINPDDPKRREALREVKTYIDEQLQKGE